MATNEINVEELLTFQSLNKLDVKAIENHYDVITTYVTFAHAEMTSLLTPFVIKATNDTAKLSRDYILTRCKSILKYVLAICSACEYELPEEEKFDEWENEMSPDVKFDNVLTITTMMISVLDILHIVFVDRDEGPIWAEEEVHPDFETNIISIIIGIKHIGNRYGFTMRDVLTKF
jgi:hypothetical protein